MVVAVAVVCVYMCVRGGCSLTATSVAAEVLQVLPASPRRDVRDQDSELAVASTSTAAAAATAIKATARAVWVFNSVSVHTSAEEHGKQNPRLFQSVNTTQTERVHVRPFLPYPKAR